MQWVNSEKQFGFLTKLLHWSIFIIFVAQYFLVYRREYFPKEAPEKLQYILLHKSLGVCVLLLALFMIFWRHLGKRPPAPPKMSKLQVYGSRFIHMLLYLSMLVMPLSGIAMSQLSGKSIWVFGGLQLPKMFDENKSLADVFYYLHLYSSYVIIGLVSLHVLAALYHHFIDKDDVLKRMSFGH